MNADDIIFFREEMDKLRLLSKKREDAFLIVAVALEEIALGGCEGDGDWSGCREHFGDEQKHEWCTPCKADDAVTEARKLFVEILEIWKRKTS